MEVKKTLNTSSIKNFDELPLFLNAQLVSRTLGVSPSSAYELLHEDGFPSLRIGSRLVVPKEQFRLWVERQTGGAHEEYVPVTQDWWNVWSGLRRADPQEAVRKGWY